MDGRLFQGVGPLSGKYWRQALCSSESLVGIEGLTPRTNFFFAENFTVVWAAAPTLRWTRNSAPGASRLSCRTSDRAEAAQLYALRDSRMTDVGGCNYIFSRGICL